MRNIGGIPWCVGCSRGHGSWRAKVGRGARDAIHRSRRSGGLRNLLGDFLVSFHFSFNISGLRTVRAERVPSARSDISTRGSPSEQ